MVDLGGGAMNRLTVTELQLLEFFGVEPKRRDEGVAWPYNDFLYRVEFDDLSMSCMIGPSYKDVRITVIHGESTIYELNAVGVDDIRLLLEKDRPLLEIVITDRDSILLALKPHFRILQQTSQRSPA